MKNIYGETVKPQYEVEFRTWSSHSSLEDAKKNNDLETFSFDYADNYRDAVKKLKKNSSQIGQIVKGDYGIGELVELRIVCYFEDDISEYNIAWYEYYENGKKIERIWE